MVVKSLASRRISGARQYAATAIVGTRTDMTFTARLVLDRCGGSGTVLVRRIETGRERLPRSRQRWARFRLPPRPVALTR